MKFPLKERPFDRVALSPARYLELERMIDAVVAATLDEYHTYVRVHNRTLHPARWKVVKKRENVAVYKELSAKENRVVGPLGVPQDAAVLTLPKLLAVGTVHGNMHDMMLGLALHDAAAALVKSSYVDDALVDCAVLHEMRGAAHDDPFRHVALKWLAKGHPAGLGSVVAPRDMVVVQSSGLVKGSSDLGYHVLHSVELPECPSLESKYGILRSRICTAFVFRQQSADVVEVYVANYVEPNGTAPESVGVLSSAKSMNGSWKAITCAHNMKLAWILKHKDRYMQSAHHSADGSASSISSDDKCELCFHRATLTGKLSDCELCDARVCSRCRVTKKLSHVNRRLELHSTKHEFCKTCLFRVVNEDAKRIAAEMYVGEAIAPWRKTDGSDGLRRGSAHSSSSSAGWRSFGDDDSHSVRSDHSSARSRDDIVYGYGARPMATPSSQRQAQPDTSSSHALVKQSSFNRQQYEARYGSSPTLSDARTVPSMDGSDRGGSHPNKPEFWELYSQMQALQMAAEKTYELAKDNSRKLQDHAP